MLAAKAETCRSCNSWVFCAVALAAVLRPCFTQANRCLAEHGVSFLQGSYSVTGEEEEVVAGQTRIGPAHRNETESSPSVRSSIFDVLKQGFKRQEHIHLFQVRVHTILQQQGLMSPGGLCLLLVVLLLMTILFTMLILANRYSSDVYMQEEPVRITDKFPATGSTQMPASSPDGSRRNLSPQKSMEELAPLRSPQHLSNTSPLLRQSTPNPLPLVKQLCPDLVVPEDCECNLLIPWLPQPGEPWTKNSLTIDDSRGIPVFRISPNDDRAQLRLAIYSAVGEGLFAYLCDDKEDNGGNVSMLTIHHASGTKYGTIHPAGGQGRTIYTVETMHDATFNLECNRDIGTIEAKDAQDHLVAIAHPRVQGTHNLGRSVRIGPLNDAGLVVLAILGSDLLAQSNK